MVFKAALLFVTILLSSSRVSSSHCYHRMIRPPPVCRHRHRIYPAPLAIIDHFPEEPDPTPRAYAPAPTPRAYAPDPVPRANEPAPTPAPTPAPQKNAPAPAPRANAPTPPPRGNAPAPAPRVKPPAPAPKVAPAPAPRVKPPGPAPKVAPTPAPPVPPPSPPPSSPPPDKNKPDQVIKGLITGLGAGAIMGSGLVADEEVTKDGFELAALKALKKTFDQYCDMKDMIPLT